MQRILRNIIRLPVRTFQALTHWAQPAYRLQREADRLIPAWFSREQIKDLEAIPGFSSPRELRLLAYLAVKAPAGGCILEIGAFKGRSTAWLVAASRLRKDHPAVISIDPHLRDTWDTFQDVVSRFHLLADGLEVHRAFSTDVGKNWQRPLAFLWVDGSHEYADVVQDIELFTPAVLPGGWVLFDDARGGKFPGVEKALAEKMFGRPGFSHVGSIKNFELFQRNG